MFSTTKQTRTATPSARRGVKAAKAAKAAKVMAATAVLAATAVTGVVATAATADAATIGNKPWKHTITVETTNVHVHQHNWIRADIDRYDGYQNRSYSYADGNGGYLNRYTPFAESTGGYLQVRNGDTFGTSTTNTVRYDGSIFMAAQLSMTVQGPGAPDPSGYRDWDVQTWNLGANTTTGWHHLDAHGAGGDFITMDYKVTNTATPQY